MKHLFFFLIFLSVASFFACQDVEKSIKGDYLPEAKGATGEIILVMDTAKWQTPLGQEIKDIFYAPLPGLLTSEPRFQVRRVQSTQMNDLLRTHKNIVYLASFEGDSPATQTLRGLFSEEVRAQIRNQKERFMQVRNDVHAKGQKVLYLFAETDAALIGHLEQNHVRLRDLFENEERQRLLQKLYVERTQTGIEKQLFGQHGATLSVPYDYDLVKSIVDAKGQSGFAHIRRLDNTLNIDRNLFFAYQPYTSTEQLDPFQIIAWRDSICKQNIFDIDRPEIYISTETLVPADPKFKQERFKDSYALEMRGAWRFTVQTGGGPFVSYIIVDEKSGRLYYIEGFVYAPGRKKRELVRELETGLWSFRTTMQPPALKAK